MALRAKCLRFLGNSFEGFFAPCSQVEFRAMPGKSQSDRSPDAAACSCDTATRFFRLSIFLVAASPGYGSGLDLYSKFVVKACHMPHVLIGVYTP